MSEFIKSYQLNVKYLDALQKFVTNSAKIPSELTGNEKAEFIRAKRDLMLRDSDFAMLPDSPVAESKKEAWRTYRQALRDLTKQSGFPDNVVWPEIDDE